MNAPPVLQSNKALPSLTNNKLPALPSPAADPVLSFSSPPPPPPKFIPDQDTSLCSNGLRLPPIDVTLSNELSAQDLGPPSGIPSSPASTDSRTKRPNPLVDLIDTEKLYVDQLTGVIRKVASAWSRSNLPPHELDLMFRSIESIYKADRSLLSRLKEIGTNPSSPKALGDLLMRWIGELEAPYTSYCERFCLGFDDWEPVRQNKRLPGVLAAFSEALPPPSASSTNPDSQIWTIDELFLLPMGRLKYFKKLYGRLLKGTQPGRNDYKLLADADEKLDKLLAIFDTRANVKVESSPPAAPGVEDDVVVDLRSVTTVPKTQEHPPLDTRTGSETSSPRGSSLSSAARSSNDTSLSSIERGPSGDLLIPLSDLEGRLSAERCLDIFTMKPRSVRLQIFPPSLSYARALRIGVETVIRFVPRSTGVEVNHPHGRVFILSDLFLLCEKMIPSEKSTETPGADMWLLYPPLAGKHLKVAKVEGEDCALQVTVLRKEKFILVFASPAMRERVLSNLNECIEFASAVHAASKHPVPPMPKLNGVPQRPPTDGIQSSQTAPELRQPSAPPMSSRSPSPRRISSPLGSRSGSASFGSGPSSRNSHDTPPVSSMSLTNSMSNLVHSLEAQVQQGGSWTQPAYDLHPAPTYPAQQSSHTEGLSNNVGQPRFVGGAPLGPSSISQGPSPQPVPVSRAGPLPGQVMSPGQYPLQRAASADHLSRRGPLGLAHSQPPMHGMVPSSAQRGPLSLPSNPQNGQLAPPNSLPPGREPSDPSVQGGPRRNPSAASFNSQPELGRGPPFSRLGMASSPNLPLPHTNSMGSMGQPQPQPRLLPPSAQFRAPSVVGLVDEPSPPTSPTANNKPLPTGPVTSTISAQMKCKVFLKQAHAQWKSLGSAKLKLYCEQPTNVKQLVVEAEDKNKSVLISTIVLTDGVERVGKTGVAVELSDKGARTGIIYMIQLRNEQAAVGLYEGLLAGSDRTITR